MAFLFGRTLLGKTHPSTRLFHESRLSMLSATDVSLLTKQKALRISFDDGKTFQLPAELLRVKSPSVEMRDRNGKERIIGGRRHVGIMNVDLVGNYALRIVFDDLHESGLYTWDFLHGLGSKKLSTCKDYIRRLREAGLKRDPKKTISANVTPKA